MKQGVGPVCDARCYELSPDRVEPLARAVILVAGMAIPEAARETVLARATAELIAPAGQARLRRRRSEEPPQARPARATAPEAGSGTAATVTDI